jgi:methylated-DNA-[protein]-cysteine S-methyltransferase
MGIWEVRLLDDRIARVDVASQFGTVSLLWRAAAQGPKVTRVVLPNEQSSWAGRLPDAAAQEMTALAELLRRFLTGEEVAFDLGLLALEECSAFQRRVLLAEAGVPRGWLTTYARLAARLEAPRAARAAGGALAHNPFPLIIPCHRAVRSDGSLGGFRGGLEMKRTLLKFEGIDVGADGRVRAEHWFY